MSVFRKAMVYLGLVDDDEYYGDDGGYYEDEPYEEPAERPDRSERPARANPPAASEPIPVTVIRSRREREEVAAPVAARTHVRRHRGADARGACARDGTARLQRRAGGR
jgi:hypothetical protein